VIGENRETARPSAHRRTWIHENGSSLVDIECPLLTQSGHSMPLSASAATQLTCGLLGAIHTSHELMVKTSNQGDNHDAFRSGHGCKRWHLRPMIDYLVD